MTNSFALLMATSGLAAACAITMTPAQQLAWDRWKACDHFGTVQMHQI